MAEWLILRMPRAADAAAVWLIADSAGRPLAAVQSGALEAAGAAASGRQVAVLVSAAEVLCLEAELPARAGARAAQLVPFALEEQLAGDIETQHFAIGAPTASGKTAVAVVARSLLEDWLAQLAAAGIKPDLLCRDAALMPRIPGYTVALLEGDTLLLVGEEGSSPLVLSTPPGGFAAAAAVARGEAVAAGNLLLHANAADWPRHASEVEAARPLFASLKVQLLGSGALPWLAAQLAVAAPINLLQGAYAPRNSLAAGWKRWRVTALLAGALLLMHAGTQLYSLWHQGRTERELDGAIAVLVGPQFADAGGSLRARIESALRDSQTPGGRAGLLPALQVLAQAMSGAPGARVQSLSFHDGAVQLKVRASDAQSIDRINQTLRASGWQADLVSGGAAGDAFEGNIQLHNGQLHNGAT